MSAITTVVPMSTVNIQEAIRIAMRHHQAGELAQAEAIYRQVLALDPDNPDALHLLGTIADRLGRHDEAVRLINRAITINPNVGFYYNNLGEAYRAMGEFASAISCYTRAIRLDPRCAQAYYNLGNALLARNSLPEAIAAYREAVRIQPDFAGAYNNLGAALKENWQLEEAITAYREAIRLNPRSAKAHSNLGLALCETERLEEAFAECQRALALDPNLSDAYANLGMVLRDQGRLNEALAACHKALAIQPDSHDGLSNLGVILRDQGRLDDSIAAFDAALRLRPDFVGAHWNKSLVLLLRGDYERGWAEFEWRRKHKSLSPTLQDLPYRDWKGSDPTGLTILVRGEQGLGDTIHFIRYARLLARRGARVMVDCQSELHSLVRNMEGVCRVLAIGEQPPPFDAYVPLLSLPLIFGTTLQTVPAEVPYLRPDAALVEKWRARFAGDAGRLKVGLVWTGNIPNRELSNRATTLAAFAPLAGIEGVRFYSLQKGIGAQETKHPPAGLHLSDFTDEIADFNDTAAMITHLDLVISVDTSVAHLAGALAKSVWTLLPFRPAWQWMLDREDSPWYPTMRLFRQSAPGDWAGLMRRVAEQLRALSRRRQS